MSASEASEKRLAAKRLVEAGKDQGRLGLVLACRGAGRNDGNGEQGKRLQGSSRKRQRGQADGREISCTKGSVENKGSQDRVSLAHKNHAWVIGKRTGSRCTASRRTCRSS